jgi:hypothetical protein
LFLLGACSLPFCHFHLCQCQLCHLPVAAYGDSKCAYFS